MNIAALIVALMASMHGASGRSLTQTTPVRFCIPYQVDASFIPACSSAIAAANTGALSFSCVPGGSPAGCIDKISAGEAEITNFGAAEQPDAANAGIIPIVAEFYGLDDNALVEYYSVAVVKSEFCASNPTLADLAGKRSCHTGFRKTAGWNMPVGFLVSQGIMDVKDENDLVTDDAESVAAFFSEVCAPRVTADGPGVGGTSWAPLCTACDGDCSEDSPYYDYAGTVHGVMEGVCDVAFTKQDVVPTYATDGSEPADWATLAKDDLALLCPNGGCASVEDYANCNLGRVPAHAIVADARNPNLDAIKDALVAAGNSEGFLESTTEVEGQENVIFAAGTEALFRVDITFEEFYDPNVLAAFEAVRALDD